MSSVYRFKKLPPAVQKEVADRLSANGYSDFEAIANDLTARGYRISKSGLHRFAQELRSDAEVLRDWAIKNPELAAILVAAIKSKSRRAITVKLHPAA